MIGNGCAILVGEPNAAGGGVGEFFGWVSLAEEICFEENRIEEAIVQSVL